MPNIQFSCLKLFSRNIQQYVHPMVWNRFIYKRQPTVHMLQPRAPVGGIHVNFLDRFPWNAAVRYRFRNRLAKNAWNETDYETTMKKKLPRESKQFFGRRKSILTTSDQLLRFKSNFHLKKTFTIRRLVFFSEIVWMLKHLKYLWSQEEFFFPSMRREKLI